MAARGFYRARAGVDTALIAWVRDDAGKLDLSEAEAITVEIRKDGCTVLTLDAASPVAGKVTFTVSAANVRQRLSLLGVYQLVILADEAEIHAGLLTVLG